MKEHPHFNMEKETFPKWLVILLVIIVIILLYSIGLPDFIEGCLGLLIIGGLIYLMGKAGNSRYNKIEETRKKYAQALKGDSKAVALNAGRIYYQALRHPDPLSIYDEQAIANDLSTMNIK